MMNSNAKAGLDFQDLARGGERNYSCSFLVNLDCDLLSLCNLQGSFLDMARNVLVGHTNRVLEQITTR